ncbi:Rap1a/Tai family immunity protein [Sphingomonas sp. 3-13AW]|uniref:Rap1a/Tai family immunity protein n=1 Tax=Sphingomonas sp. 3-13AW TaxID=3050450 RepID=UPI003BB6244D
MIPAFALLLALSAPQATSRNDALVATPTSPSGGLFSAGQLRQRCLSSGAADASYCFAYIAGVHDAVRAYEAWLNLREFCAPRRVPQGDLRRAFMNYLSEHPNDVGGEAASVVVVSLKIAYPCSTEERQPGSPGTP